jgi:ribosome-binding protein aMBF1 (putative translation factor)
MPTEGATMGDERPDLAVKVPAELLDRATELVPAVQEQPQFRWVPVSKAAVVRLALDHGLDLLAAVHAGDGAARERLAAVLGDHPTERPLSPSQPPQEPQQTSIPGTPPPTKPKRSRKPTTPRKPPAEFDPTTAAGAQLRVWREGQGLTQKDVAAQLGMGQSTLSALETGKRQPTAKQIAKLAELAGIPADAWTTPTNEDG